MRLRECKEGMKVKDSELKVGLGKIIVVNDEAVKVNFPQKHTTMWYATPEERRYLKRV